MTSSPSTEQIQLFRSLFKGRDDVFAIRWEKGKKTGYGPAYHYDPFMFRVHQMKGGTLNTYQDKNYRRLTDEEISKHLAGQQFIGIYPLSRQNSSWFIVADFDKENWREESRNLIKACEQLGIAAYLERSRSGAGGHVWIFFEEPYPAIKSRNIVKSLLEQTGSISIFDKNSSFDRLFPNQDELSGKKLGNLIALPLHHPLVEKGNNCFVDPETLQPFSDQWAFLTNIKRVATSQLDRVLDTLNSSKTSTKTTENNHVGKLTIQLDNALRINRLAINSNLKNFLTDELNFWNSEYFSKKQVNKNTWGIQRYFSLVEESQNEVILPRGFIGKLLRYCQQEKIDFEFLDKRKKQETVVYSCNLQLRQHQKKVLEATAKKDFGIIVAPPGSGKTVMALKIIAEKQQPALIVVHRKQLMEQWLDRIESFLGIPKKEIGKIGQGRVKLGEQITVAMIQSLAKKIEKGIAVEWFHHFGLLIVDECHHLPAKTFHTTIAKLNTYFQYGLTATPFRKYSDGKLIFTQLGEVIAEVKPQEVETFKKARIVIRNTSFDIPFNPKIDPFENLSKVLIHDTARNKLIIKDIVDEVQRGKRVVIITERREHIQTLNQFLKQSYETITISGEDSEATRKSKWKLLKAGSFQVVITTGQYFGEGVDLQNVSRLFLVYPFSFKGKLIQYLGRVQRSEITPVIYDYRDQKIEYLNRLFLKRNSYYRHLDKQATLFDDYQEEQVVKNNLSINEKIKIPVAFLEFQYGLIVFDYVANKGTPRLKIEIEHDYIRPEFEVLKPYIEKHLGTKRVLVHIQAEFENGQLVSQVVNCPELELINREIIEGVRFKFFDDSIFQKKAPQLTEDKFLDLDQLQEAGNLKGLFENEGELLEDILQNKNFKHYKQLKYLSERHEGRILKLRFMLDPFSFVFLLDGNKQYHAILETLDTEEATYIWHLEKDTKLLPAKLQDINQDLTIIKNQGRQVFLQNAPKNFSRIIHNYADERKGFILWRDLLEEKLF